MVRKVIRDTRARAVTRGLRVLLELQALRGLRGLRA
jgi:hypothetical protein